MLSFFVRKLNHDAQYIMHPAKRDCAARAFNFVSKRHYNEIGWDPSFMMLETKNRIDLLWICSRESISFDCPCVNLSAARLGREERLSDYSWVVQNVFCYADNCTREVEDQISPWTAVARTFPGLFSAEFDRAERWMFGEALCVVCHLSDTLCPNRDQQCTNKLRTFCKMSYALWGLRDVLGEDVIGVVGHAVALQFYSDDLYG